MSKKYDYSKIHYDGDFRKKMIRIADSLEEYVNYIKTYIIFNNMSEDEYNEHMETAEKINKKLRKGDISVFNIDELNNLLDNGYDITFDSD